MKAARPAWAAPVAAHEFDDGALAFEIVNDSLSYRSESGADASGGTGFAGPDDAGTCWGLVRLWGGVLRFRRLS